MARVKAYRSKRGNYIFVSYAHDDKEIVFPFIEQLQKRYNVWFDEGLGFGREWEEEIKERINKCSLFLFMVSEKSIRSPYCKDELELVTKNNKVPFVNIILKDFKLPKSFMDTYGKYQMMYLYKYSSLFQAVKDLSDKTKGIRSTKAKLVPPKTVGVAYKYTSIVCQTVEKYIDYTKRHYIGHQYVLTIKNDLFEELKKIKDTDDDCLITYSYMMIDKNPKEVYEIAVRLSGKKLARGYHLLGYCYDNGFGVEKDDEIAVNAYRMAAKMGFALSQNMLGIHYLNGTGIEKDYDEAFYWFSCSAQQDYSMAINNLGYCYENGFGVDQSYQNALTRYSFAGLRGYAQAYVKVGDMYFNGIGRAQNYESAVRYYGFATKKGIAEAYYKLGICYENGYGVDKDIEKAIKHYEIAADKGHKLAREALFRLI